MHKLLILLAVVAALYACKNSNASNNSNNNNQELPQSTGPDASDLLMTLQGRWQSQQDSTYVLEILDTKMRHINHGQLTEETEIEIDGSCQTTPCKMDSTDLTDGWCFMEKGPKTSQCNIIITCDKEFLKYTAIGAANGLLVFKKL
jgi:hypothetical protein